MQRSPLRRDSRRPVLLGLALLLAGSLVRPAGATPMACQALSAAPAGPDTRIAAVEWIAGDPARRWRGPATPLGRAEMDRPFCRVVATVRAAGGSTVGFELWLPPRERWNGRFFGTASAGYAGAVQHRALVNPVTRGYAAMAHDNGQASTGANDLAWATDDRGRLAEARIADFADGAQHAATVAARRLTAVYYGRPPQRAYFLGCGQGGHHGLMEAARHPEDYDGIVAGAAQADWSAVLAAQGWAAWQAARPGALPKALLAALGTAAVARCDGLDGAADGQIEDPRRCSPTAALPACPGPGAASACLTPDQAATVEALYRGGPAAPGLEVGSEAGWAAAWSREAGPGATAAPEFLRLLGGHDPSWNFLTLDPGRDLPAARDRAARLLDVPAGPLDRFAARGGRLILYHGWSDPLVPPRLTVRRWEGLGAARDRFARLFMVPAMGHCGGGPVGAADWLTAIEGWVERGTPPDLGTRNAVVGSGPAGGRLRERVLCPYPTVARWLGSGDLNADGNFRCVAPQDG